MEGMQLDERKSRGEVAAIEWGVVVNDLSNWNAA